MFKNKTRSHIKRIGNKYLIKNNNQTGGNITRKNNKIIGGAWPSFGKKQQNSTIQLDDQDMDNIGVLADQYQNNPMLNKEQQNMLNIYSRASKYVPKSVMKFATNKAIGAAAKEHGISADEVNQLTSFGKDVGNVAASTLNEKSSGNNSASDITDAVGGLMGSIGKDGSGGINPEAALMGAVIGEAAKNPEAALGVINTVQKFDNGGPMGGLGGLMGPPPPPGFGPPPPGFAPPQGGDAIPPMSVGISGMPNDEDAMYKRIYSNICNNIDEVFRKNFDKFSNNIETQITTILQNPTSRENFERAINATFISIFNDFTRQYNEDPALKNTLNDKILDLIKENLRSYLSNNIDKIDPADAKYLIGLISPSQSEVNQAQYVENKGTIAALPVATPVYGGKKRNNKKCASKTTQKKR